MDRGIRTENATMNLHYRDKLRNKGEIWATFSRVTGIISLAALYIVSEFFETVVENGQTL